MDNSNNANNTPTHLLIACTYHMQAVVMTFDPATPWETYRSKACHGQDMYSHCDCVAISAVGKTEDGELAYYVPAAVNDQTRYMTVAPHQVEFDFDYDVGFKLSDFALYTANDPVLTDYLIGATDAIVRRDMPAFIPAPRPNVEPVQRVLAAYADEEQVLDDQNLRCPPDWDPAEWKAAMNWMRL